MCDRLHDDEESTLRELIRATGADRIGALLDENKRLRRVIVLLCLLGLGLIAYGFLHNAFLSGASALAVGSSWGDFIA